MSGTSGIDFFPVETDEGLQPRYKTTAYAEGVIFDPMTKLGVQGATGVFNMWLEGTPVVVNRAMPAASDLGAGWVRCAITDLELAEHGLYQWEMVITAPGGTPVLNDSGDFSI